MRDFLHSVDKQHSGLVPSANFMKVMRVFGIPAPSSSMITSHTLSNGMVEYEEIVEDMAANYA
jgi:Ca2+-binding EF-hand superfamily protein